MPAPSSHWLRPQTATTLRGSAGQPGRERGCVRSGDGGVPAPATLRGCWCPTLATSSGCPRPRAAARDASNRGAPFSLLPASSMSNAEGRSRWGKRPRNQKRDGKGNGSGGGDQTTIKKKVTKGKNTNSLTEYKDLESDGATIASLERGGHGHAPPASSTTRFGALGAQPSPCPGGEEEGWPGARTAQCSPHPRRGFGEGG